jgi:argininosuccinate lyase
LGIPFREAHHVTGRAVAAAEARGLDLADMPLEALREIEPRITGDVYSVLTPAASAASRTSWGGTAPAEVRRQVERWKNGERG